MKLEPVQYAVGFEVDPELLRVDEIWNHLTMSEYHADFCGRKYRRGRNRCLVCGARK